MISKASTKHHTFHTHHLSTVFCQMTAINSNGIFYIVETVFLCHFLLPLFVLMVRTPSLKLIKENSSFYFAKHIFHKILNDSILILSVKSLSHNATAKFLYILISFNYVHIQVLLTVICAH